MWNSLSFSTAGLALVALIAGALVPFQAGSNAALGRALGHPLWATVASLMVSLLMVVPVLIALRVPMPLVGQALRLPLWAWLGGVAGVIYLTAALMLTPKLGATTFIVIVIAGQMLTSLAIDHFGLMGLAVKPVNAGRIAGVALICVGMLLVQWFTRAPQPVLAGNVASLAQAVQTAPRP